MNAPGGASRVYRRVIDPQGDLVTFRVRVKETDLFLWARRDLAEVAMTTVLGQRRALEAFLEECPAYRHSLAPLPHRVGEPAVMARMVEAAAVAGVGPMAAVAGAFADVVGESLLQRSDEVMVENGGDVFLATGVPRRISVWSREDGGMPVTVEIEAGRWGVCTSSATIGPSPSFGDAEAVAVLAGSASLADALATAYCNRTASRCAGEVIEDATSDPRVEGMVIVKGGEIALCGKLALVAPE